MSEVVMISTAVITRKERLDNVIEMAIKRVTSKPPEDINSVTDVNLNRITDTVQKMLSSKGYGSLAASDSRIREQVLGMIKARSRPKKQRQQQASSIIVKFKSKMTMSEAKKFASGSNFVAVEPIGPAPNSKFVFKPQGMSVESGVNRLKNNPAVIYAEPNYKVSASRTPTTVSDSDFEDTEENDQDSEATNTVQQSIQSMMPTQDITSFAKDYWPYLVGGGALLLAMLSG